MGINYSSICKNTIFHLWELNGDIRHMNTEKQMAVWELKQEMNLVAGTVITNPRQIAELGAIIQVLETSIETIIKS